MRVMPIFMKTQRNDCLCIVSGAALVVRAVCVLCVCVRFYRRVEATTSGCTTVHDSWKIHTESPQSLTMNGPSRTIQGTGELVQQAGLLLNFEHHAAMHTLLMSHAYTKRTLNDTAHMP